MRFWRIAASLSVLLCLLLDLCACAGTEESEVVGSDWRTWGLVDFQSEIVRDGETVPVCLCAGDGEAVFYLDQPEQTEFARLSYPQTIEDARTCLHSLGLDDLDGDGNGDIMIDFVFDDESRISLVWLWNGADYAYDEALSDLGALTACLSLPRAGSRPV